MDELALADQTQPRHMRFLTELPENLESVPSSQTISPNATSAEFSQKVGISHNKVGNMFDDKFGSIKKTRSSFVPLTHEKIKASGYNLGF